MNPITAWQIKIIHILIQQHGIDDDLYREKLRVNYGVDSCKKLTYHQASDLITKLGGKPYKPKPKKRLTDKQRWTIEKKWDIVSRTDALKRDIALNKFVQRITGVGLLTWLTPKEATKVLIALNAMIENENNKV